MGRYISVANDVVLGRLVLTLTQVGSYYILNWPAIYYCLSEFASDFFEKKKNR